jgi:hypothetical protein
MSIHGFMLVLAGCAVTLAGWIIVRFPRLAPQSGRGVSVWIAVAIACFVGAPLAVTPVGLALGGVAAALLVALPAAICIFLACGWMMLFVIRAIAPFR